MYMYNMYNLYLLYVYKTKSTMTFEFIISIDFSY